MEGRWCDVLGFEVISKAGTTDRELLCRIGKDVSSYIVRTGMISRNLVLFMCKSLLSYALLIVSHVKLYLNHLSVYYLTSKGRWVIDKKKRKLSLYKYKIYKIYSAYKYKISSAPLSSPGEYPVVNPLSFWEMEHKWKLQPFSPLLSF